MGFAIITEKHANGKVNIKATSPLTTELEKQARDLDKYLERRVPELIKELIAEGLLEETVVGNLKKQKEGVVQLWHSLGTKLRAICYETGIQKRRERRWLWEAMENVYPTNPIRRASRGRARIHFEYCYRLAQFPIEFAKQLHWSEWVTFFDSKTVREEQRIDDWLRTMVEQGTTIGRSDFRKFVQTLNKRIRNIDTSELTTEELFRIYDSVWTTTLNDLHSPTK
jgi:hypothetical protein